jgi:hypothetical protein
MIPRSLIIADRRHHTCEPPNYPSPGLPPHVFRSPVTGQRARFSLIFLPSCRGFWCEVA